MTTSTEAFAALMAFSRETCALEQIAGRLGWDQETVMPRGAAPQRAEEFAAIEGVLHARRTDPRVGDWLATAEAPDEQGAAQMREIRRMHDRAVKVPGRLAQEIARVTSAAQGIWAAARAADEMATFLPALADVVRLKREEAACLAGSGRPYDALLDDHEPGATEAEVAAMFDALRPRLSALRAACLDSPHQPRPVEGVFGREAQLRLARKLAQAFGYDWEHGRLDIAVHPFSSGSGRDVRITTRVVESDPFNCFYSTIHEVGHACYELGVDADYGLTAIGRGASMGVHESQSRLYENQLGRSRAFTGWLHGRMVEAFGDFGTDDPEEFYRAVNTLRPGFIRTEADEVQYNLHVMLRFDLERALFAGDLSIDDLEAAWNDRFLADFGLRVERPSLGMLQDVHWSIGYFGYFPTYTLGNLYAGCLHGALRREVPGLDAALEEGDPSPATEWLRENLQRHGALYGPAETVERACGHVPGPDPLLAYLEAKFGEIYRL